MFMPGVWILWSKKKIVIIFQKENGNTFTLLIIFIVKSLQKEQNSTNLLLWLPICRNKSAITLKWFNSLDTNSISSTLFGFLFGLQVLWWNLGMGGYINRSKDFVVVVFVVIAVSHFWALADSSYIYQKLCQSPLSLLWLWLFFFAEGRYILRKVESKYELWCNIGCFKLKCINWIGSDIRLNRTGHVSFLTGQDRTPKFAELD